MIRRLEIELTPAPGRYGRYMKLVENLMTESANAGTPLTAREVDTASYWLGG